MRERLFELLPIVLVGVVLVVVQLKRSSDLTPAFLPLATSTPTTQALAAAPSTARPQRPTAASSVSGAVLVCNPAQPRFIGRVAMLRAALGASMGDPTNCESAIDTTGNTQQNTSTGLAYVRRQSNVACFTTGWDHWALLPDGALVHWAGEAIDPPANARRMTRP